MTEYELPYPNSIGSQDLISCHCTESYVDPEDYPESDYKFSVGDVVTPPKFYDYKMVVMGYTNNEKKKMVYLAAFPIVGQLPFYLTLPEKVLEKKE